jgi:hypothetical protein
MPRVVAARARQADMVQRAQAAGIVSAALPAGRLVDRVLTLARGHFMDAVTLVPGRMRSAPAQPQASRR